MEDNGYKKKIRKFRQRLNTEAGIRAGTIGLAAGLAVMAVVLLYGRLRYQSILTKEAGVIGAALFLAVTLVCYFAWLRPKKKEVLARIDALGLKERIITMEELKQEDTVIARWQRKDATEHLNRLDTASMDIRLYIKPFICSLVLAVAVVLQVFLPLPEVEIDPLAQQNSQEMQIVDEMITALRELVDESWVNDEHRAELNEIIDALEVSFAPEDSTLTRTAKIATASKRLDMYESTESAAVTLKKQQAETSAEAEAELPDMEFEFGLLSDTIAEMKDIMGTSIDALNAVDGTFWTPEEPSSDPSQSEEEMQQEQEPAEGEEPPEGMEPGEGEEPPEGMEPGEGEEPPEGMEGNMNSGGNQSIYDPEQGQVSYGQVYEQYYQEILNALTEQELSEEIRDMIEDYANSLN